ncbi:uncharacterized protein EI90DRAFT_3062395 [Cantharellus anzutake]|uniref:uncharacterized protein n=1 Tax=Cantharellus anzutake TaxID=1750568 RepID=UPI0019075910|nr:uncharacterized protein EI90DRAFT_3062395 [Cantharellus anzutake]KAF8329368.1 hypothetical protein EI90DRAFT_3062395 [Cantharellus anzutake]
MADQVTEIASIKRSWANSESSHARDTRTDVQHRQVKCSRPTRISSNAGAGCGGQRTSRPE